MPIYPIACASCNYHGDVAAPMSEVDADGCLLCPECGSRAPQRYEDKAIHDPNTVFAGSQQFSITEGYRPQTAKEAQRLFGEYGDCINPTTGRVSFKDRQQQQGYAAKKEELLQAARAKRRARGERVEEVL